MSVLLGMTTKNLIACSLLSTLALLSFNANSQLRGAEKDDVPKIYTDRANALLDKIANEDLLSDSLPLSDSELTEYRKILRKKDNFSYSPNDELIMVNKKLPISLRDSEIPIIKLGHTFTTTLVFTDVAGNPWTVDSLTDISNSDVVSVSKKAPHILSIRPLKRAGKTNLPVKLKGHQRPITFLFDISDKEVYFNVDVQANDLGDHVGSQQIRAVNSYAKGEGVAPKLSIEPDKEIMLQLLTPPGYQDMRLFDEFRQPVDARDFVAWRKDGKLYLLTPHDSYTPDPIDVTSAPDGVHKLLEFDELPVITVRKKSQIMMLFVE